MKLKPKQLQVTEGKLIQGTSTGTAETAFTLPTTDGSNGQVLKTNGSGTVTWSDESGGGGGGSPFSENVLPSAADTYDLGSTSAEWKDLYLGDDSVIYLGNDQDVQLKHSPDEGVILDMTSAGGYEPKFIMESNNTSNTGPTILGRHQTTDPDPGDRIFRIWGKGRKQGSSTDQNYAAIDIISQNVTSSAPRGQITFLCQGSSNFQEGLRVYCDATATATPKVRISDAFDLPNADGTANQVLQTDGNGAVSWATVSSGGGGSFAASDITGQTEHSTNLSNDDYLVVYDSSASALKKITKGNFFKGSLSSTIPDFWSLNVGDFTFDTSGSTNTQYLRLKMNANENASEPIFLVENQSSSTNGSIIALGIREQNSNTVGDGDTLGLIRFQETQSNGGITKWASISGKINDNANNYGQLELSVRSGTSEDVALICGTGSGGTFVNIENHDGTDSGLKLNGTLVTSSASELNLLDGGTAVGSSITIQDADGFIINDNGTMKSIPASALKTYASSGGGSGASRPAVTEITSTPLTISSPASSVLELVYVCDSGASVVTLPTAVGNEGLKVQVKNRIASTITVNAPNPGTQQTIDGSNSVSIATQYESLTFISDNTNWNII